MNCERCADERCRRFGCQAEQDVEILEADQTVCPSCGTTNQTEDGRCAACDARLPAA